MNAAFLAAVAPAAAPAGPASTLTFGWFDGVAIICILVGVMIGRKRGMSTELLSLIDWIIMVVAAAFLYQPVARLIDQSGVFSSLFLYIMCYLGIVILSKLIFTIIKKLLGGKLAGSDLFGRAEYYLGMISGGIRFACLVIMFLAVMNAPYYTPEQIASEAAKQKENYGSSFFPSIPSLQKDIFVQAFSGRMTKKHLSQLLIRPTPGTQKKLTDLEGPAKRTQKTIDEFTNPNSNK
jgi:uncharacterized membrane protein required for colicin V production